MRYFLLALSAWIVITPVTVWPFEFYSCAENNQAESKQSQEEASHPPAFTTPNASPNPKGHSYEVASEGEPKSVRITELPPNDTWHKAYVIATIILVAVGIGGIFIANKTLKTIERQTRATEDSAIATRDNINLLISKERARIRIDFVELTFVGMAVRRRGPPRESDHINFQVFCYGGTNAFVLESRIDVLITESPEENTNDWGCGSPMDLPKVLIPSEHGIRLNEPIDPEIDHIMESSPTAKHTKFFLQFRAFIRYRDVFQTNTQWEMKSRYIWAMTYHHPADMDAFFSWTQHSQRDTEKEYET